MNTYEKLPIKFLAGFYFELNKNIKQGIMVERMMCELKLIEKAAEKRGLSTHSFYDYLDWYKSSAE